MLIFSSFMLRITAIDRGGQDRVRLKRHRIWRTVACGGMFDGSPGTT